MVDIHWADTTASRVIKEQGDKRKYVCASGITPSGHIHIGNFREVITTDLIVRALESRGKDVRFIYSWDDYDRLRKIPKTRHCEPPARRAERSNHLFHNLL